MTLPQYQAQLQQAQQALQQQMQQQPQIMPQTMNSTIVWVKRQKEAEDYLVAPNNSVVFMDEAMTHLYMKSADQFGRPSFTSKLLTDEEPEVVVEEPKEKPQTQAPSIDIEKYMTKEEFRSWVDEKLERRLSEIQQRNNQPSGRKQNGKGGN